MTGQNEFDIVIVGAGVLGSAIAYELSLAFTGRIAVIEKEDVAGKHTSTRNTGVIHRPFYLDPSSKAVFAKSAQDSYPLWMEIANRFNLPWNQVGTLEVATREEDLGLLSKYEKWACENGMYRSEFQLFNGEELRSYEPEVKGFGAILSKTDTAVSFGLFTKKLMEIAQKNGVTFLHDTKVETVSETGDGVTLKGTEGNGKVEYQTDFLVNASSGSSLKFSHQLGYSKEYAVLHFRGDYWKVSNDFKMKAKHNIYTVPKHKKYPFLDPHFILRHDGSREVGPTASLVSSPYDYTDSPDEHSLLMKILEKPSIPKIKLAVNPEFINLVRTEWRSSRSKNAMSKRVRGFIPSLEDKFLLGHGLSGVRNSLIDRNGFVPEAIIEKGKRSMHILNFNSPGATGAPAYAMHILKTAETQDFLKLNESRGTGLLWEEYYNNSL